MFRGPPRCFFALLVPKLKNALHDLRMCSREGEKEEERDDDECQSCGPGTVEHHHKIPQSLPDLPAHITSNLVVTRTFIIVFFFSIQSRCRKTCHNNV